jgi:hypothetical protein
MAQRAPVVGFAHDGSIPPWFSIAERIVWSIPKVPKLFDEFRRFLDADSGMQPVHNAPFDRDCGVGFIAS